MECTFCHQKEGKKVVARCDSYLTPVFFQRLLDFNQRLNFHRCSSSTSLSDDYYGEKIQDLSDYRYWLVSLCLLLVNKNIT